MEDVRALGAHVTRDWTKNDKINDPVIVAAEDDLGVFIADVVILLMTDPDYAYRRTCTELGIALGARCRNIWIVGPSTTAAASNVFWHHPFVRHFDDMESAKKELAEMCDQRQK